MEILDASPPLSVTPLFLSFSPYLLNLVFIFFPSSQFSSKVSFSYGS